jgi:flavin-dependent dehydrogenase
MYDAIVIGARCAGSPTAMLLARKGYRVLLVDRAKFPSDTMSTHYIHQPGVLRLARWGLLDRVAASGCPPVSRLSLDFGPFTLAGPPPAADGVAEGYAPRRYVLDPILADAAIEAGVEFRDRFSVETLLWDGDRVTGLRGHGRDGASVDEPARLVIGADGMHSLVARSVQAPAYNEKPPTNCGYYTYWSGVPVSDFEIFVRERCAFGAFPTNDGLTLIVVGRPHEEFASIRTDIEGSYLRAIDLAPSLAERVRGGRREERFIGTADLPYFYRRPYGPGWALVGDAGYHKDPSTAEGISDAFRDAELLAEAIDAGFSGHEPLDEALAGYQQRRDEATAAIYEFTHQLASYEPPPPEMQQLLHALVGNQEQTNRFLGLIAGTTPFAEFFAPENVQQILAHAAEQQVLPASATSMT